MTRPSLRSFLFGPGQAFGLPRLLFTVPALAFAFFFLSPAGGFEFGPPPAAAADIMQCMEECIRNEGGNTAANKTTCKMRCANVPSVFGHGQGTAAGGQPAPRDSGSCMSSYKDCKEVCGKKDKKCNRVCKKALMRCQ